MIGECFLCHQWGELEEHHVFGASRRKASTKYGLTVRLCHKCHNEPPDGVHHSKENMAKLHKYGQLKAMRENDWSINQFREIFKSNYLDEEDYL